MKSQVTNITKWVSDQSITRVSIIPADRQRAADVLRQRTFATPVTYDILKGPPSLSGLTVPSYTHTNISLKYSPEYCHYRKQTRISSSSMGAILECQSRFWLRYFRRFDLPEIDPSVFVYPCYFLFANRHSFNCSVGLPPGHRRQGSVHFNVQVVFAKWYHVFGRDPPLCLAGAGNFTTVKARLGDIIWFNKYFQSVVHQSSRKSNTAQFSYFELSLCSDSAVGCNTNWISFTITYRPRPDVFAHIKNGATHCYVFIISSHESLRIICVYM